MYATGIHRALNFDEGNYLASLDALRHGQRLGADVFLDQPPGWYVLLQLAGAMFGNTATGVRAALLCIALLGLVAAWACGRAIAGPAAGLAAAALLAIAPPFPALAASVESDPPSTVLALGAVALALWAYRGRTRPALAFAAGLVLALALSVKLFAVVAVPVVGLLALRRGRGALWAVAGAAVVPLAILVAYRNVLGDVWTGVVGAHVNARGGQAVLGPSNLHRVVATPDPRTAFGVLALCGLVAAVLFRQRATWPLWLLVAGAVAFTLAMKPLLDHHLVLLAATLAVAAGTSLGAVLGRWPRAAVPVAALALAGGFVQQERALARNDVPETREVTWAVARVRALTRPDERIVSDVPSVAYLAGRRMPGQLIDTSIARIQDEYLAPRDVVRLIRDSGVRVVVVGRLFTTKPEIVEGIAASFPRVLRGPGVRIYVRR